MLRAGLRACNIASGSNFAQDGNTYPTTMADSSGLWEGANC